MAKNRGTTLDPQDLAAIAQLPGAAKVGGGINAFDQAAFSNPVAPTSEFGIVPTAPLPLPVVVPPAPLPPPATQPTGSTGPRQPIFGVPGIDLPHGPRGEESRMPVRYGPASAEKQAAILRMFGLPLSAAGQIFPHVQPQPGVVAPKPATPPPPPPVPATPQHIQAVSQGFGIRDPNQSDLARSLHAQGQPPLTVEGLQRITAAYATALDGNPANTQLAENRAMAHLDVERALAPLGGMSPIEHGGAG